MTERTMINSSHFSYFTLSAYVDTGHLRYLFFWIALTLYVLIIVTNLFLVVLICINRSLHEPMYVFLCSLFINELYGSTALFPLLLLQILSDLHTVAAPLCFLQIFCLFSYGSVELACLSVMSYDRYVSICSPLQYGARMTPGRVVVLVSLSWFPPMVSTVLLLSMVLPHSFCGDVINKVYCDNYSVVKLSCSDTFLNNVLGLLYAALTITCPLSLIFYTYVKILQVCFSGSQHTRHKAISTCSPHLAALLSFCLGTLFEIVQSRFDLSSAPRVLRIFLSLYFLSCQPLLTPVVYGLSLSRVRVVCEGLAVPQP